MRLRFMGMAAALAAVAPLTAPAALAAAKDPAWKSLPQVKPAGTLQHTGSYTVPKDQLGSAGWKEPKFVYNEKAATGRKEAKVVVVIYNPVLESEGGKTLIQHINGNDPVHYSHILADVIRNASWGYINYNIVDVIEVDGYAKKVDGFRYTDESFLEVRKTQKWQPSTSSYEAMLAENGLIERIKKEGITEVWLWGAGGMHWDEFAFFIPNRYARYAPTDNEWFYRPYDIPDMGKTFWVMGFNYEVGPDNMVHSYVHRVESMAALAYGKGYWDTAGKRDPWNVFSWLETDHPGTPSMVGNCHVPPNGQSGYDYSNKRTVQSWADNWYNYPDLRGEPRTVSLRDWGDNHFGYMRWILDHLPKYPGSTDHGYNNWWVHIANTDEDLPDWKGNQSKTFTLPANFPAPVQK